VGALAEAVMLEVLHNALAGIADGMALTLVRTSRSSIVRQGLDFSTAVLSPKGELVGQGLCLPIHLGGMMPALEACLRYYGGRVYPGDIFINNDPYEGASHLLDFFLFKPVFAGDVLLGYVCAMSHHTDVGGRVAGGSATDSTEIYQEGLRIPPLKLYERDGPNETLFRIIEKAVRVPDQVLGDLQGQMAALAYGERELLALAQRYGVEALIAFEAGLLDYTETLTRSAIRALPDGEWSFSDHVDNDGLSPDPITVVVRLTKQDDTIHVDFAGTSPQCKAALNPMLATTQAMVYAVVRTVLGGELPNTAGCFRPVTVTAPEGSFANASPPAAVGARALGFRRMAHALFGAFAQMLPSKLPACFGGSDYMVVIAGYHRDGLRRRGWVLAEAANEVAYGGFPFRDGTDAQSSPVSNNTNTPAEIIEIDHPVRIEEYGLLPDAEGAGMFRGGVGLVRQYRFLQDETVVQIRTDRQNYPPYGLHGGQPARPARLILDPDGERRAVPGKCLLTVKAGEVLRVEMPGGGGWGDPLQRDPEFVLEDVIAEKVSPARAREVYGVVVDAARRQVDVPATRRLREGLRARRGEAGPADGAVPQA
jgi:N-methylhydantoinase B